MNMRKPRLRGLRGRGWRRGRGTARRGGWRRGRGTARRGMRSNLRTLAGSQIYEPLNGRTALTEFKLRAGTPASGCRADMGGGAESIDAKLVEVELCEDCEAGDGGAGQGAAPDRTCGYTQRMFTN